MSLTHKDIRESVKVNEDEDPYIGVFIRSLLLVFNNYTNVSK